MAMSHPATVVSVRADTFLATSMVDDSGLPQCIAEVFALRLGRRHSEDVEVLTESCTWRTVRPGQRLRVVQDRHHALNAWPPHGGWPEELLRATRERAAEKDAT